MAVERRLERIELAPRMEVDLSGLVAVFDLDGTLVKGTFEDSVGRFALRLAEVANEPIEVDQIVKQWRGIQHSFRDILQVDPVLAIIATQIIMEQQGVSQQSEVGRRLVGELSRDLYHAKSVQLCEGAAEVVSLAAKKCQAMHIATIALPGWTNRKVNLAGFRHYFPNGNVYPFNVRIHKAKQWPDFFKFYQLEPKNVFMTGDTYEADIEPMLNLGARYVFWVNNGRFADEEFWGRQVPKEVIRLETVGELTKYL